MQEQIVILLRRAHTQTPVMLRQANVILSYILHFTLIQIFHIMSLLDIRE